MLTLDYRPARFAELVGQHSARLVLQSHVARQQMPPAFLFRGGPGSGKTSAARVLAAALNCQHPQTGDCCAECESCISIRSGSSLAIHEIDAASHGGVDDIRALRELVQYSADRPWRVVLLDEAQSIGSKQAFNALLKTLEEPPPQTVFALLTTDPDRIPKTVQSRAMPVDFGPVPLDAVLTRLEQIRAAEQLEISDELLAEVAELSDGGLRGAIVMLDQIRTVKVSEVSQLHALLGLTDAPTRIIEAALASDLDRVHSVLDEFFRHSADVSALVSGLIRVLHQRYAERRLDAARLVQATKLMWSARTISAVADRNSRAQATALVTYLFSVLADAPILQEKDRAS